MIKRVFSKPKYLSIALITAVVVFALAVWLPNWRLIVTVFSSSSVTFVEALSITFSLFLSIGTNFTLVSATYTVLIAILFGMNLALLWFYISTRKGTLKGSGTALGVGGLVSGVFGIGCAACGTFILSSILALVGGAGILAFLPLGGEEFGILGVVLLGYAVYWTAKKVEEPLVC